MRDLCLRVVMYHAIVRAMPEITMNAKGSILSVVELCCKKNWIVAGQEWSSTEQEREVG